MKKAQRRKEIDDYLRRFEHGLGDVPDEVRREIVDDLRRYIQRTWTASANRSDAAFRGILERLGSPEGLAHEERMRLGREAPRQPKVPDLFALAAVVLTAVVWPVGIALVWLSSRWPTRDKLLATAFPVVGVLLLFISFAPTPAAAPPQPGTTPIEVPREMPRPGASELPDSSLLVSVASSSLMLLGLGAPLLAAIYLALRMGPSPRRSALLVPTLSGLLVVLALAVIWLGPAGGGVSG